VAKDIISIITHGDKLTFTGSVAKIYTLNFSPHADGSALSTRRSQSPFRNFKEWLSAHRAVRL
jgi:hypothetical protein